MRCSVGVVVKRARIVALVSRKRQTLYELAIVELFKGILAITEVPLSVVLGQI